MLVKFVATALLFQRVLGNNYTTFSETAFNTLQGWYNHTTGLWDVAGYYHSPQCTTVLADLAAADGSLKANISRILSNTHTNVPSHKPHNIPAGNWLDQFYDNEGWWALAWIKAYDVTGETSYLQTAADIFDDMTGAWEEQCGGGIWWDRNHTEINTIANTLFLSVGAHLANRANGTSIGHNKAYYLGWVAKEYDWYFQKSGLVLPGHLLNDHLNITTCKPEGTFISTYNQGVILGGLVEYNIAAPNNSYLAMATDIANAALKNLTTPGGIIYDHCEPHCGYNGQFFKGVLVRNLQQLETVAPSAQYVSTFQKNANSIWMNDRQDNKLGQVWQGPVVSSASYGPNAITQAAGMDALIAASVP